MKNNNFFNRSEGYQINYQMDNNNPHNDIINSNNNQNKFNRINNQKQNNNNIPLNNSILSSRNTFHNLGNKVNNLNQKNNNSNQKNHNFSDEEMKDLKKIFDLFDINHTGKIDIKELVESMKSLGYDKSNPTLFQMFNEWNIQEENKKITFEEFVNWMNDKLNDNKSEEGIKRIFNSFKGDPNSNVINFDAMKKVCIELGENMSDEEIKEMLINASKSGKPELTFEEFYEIMTKDIN